MARIAGCGAIFMAAAPAHADSTFTIADPPLDFGVIDNNPYDGFGDTGPFPSFDTIGFGFTGEKREIAEFDLAPFSIPPGEFISRAVYEVRITSIMVTGFGVPLGDTPDSLAVYGYSGNGIAELSDFEAGVFLDRVATPNPSVGDILTFEVTAFIDNLVMNGRQWAGLAARGEEFGLMSIAEGNGFPRLIVETRVPACPGDLDGDNDVDLADLGILLSAYGINADGDLDGDGDTDLADLGILLSNFGNTCS